jgi:hypothetical protein
MQLFWVAFFLSEPLIEVDYFDRFDFCLNWDSSEYWISGFVIWILFS